jgi:hypothetical protein
LAGGCLAVPYPEKEDYVAFQAGILVVSDDFFSLFRQTLSESICNGKGKESGGFSNFIDTRVSGGNIMYGNP